MDEMKMYMENLDEYITDENRLVTYKWLSINLQISSNYAKRLLQHYISSLSDTDKASITITYLVVGLQETSNGGQQTKICVVTDSELSSLEESLDSVECVHIYSVSKSQLKDLPSALYTADYDATKQNLHASTQYGSITCKESKLRSDADLADLRKQGTYRPSTPQDSRHAPDPRLAPRPPLRDSAPAQQKTNPEKNKKKETVASMFANAPKKVKKEVKEEINTEKKSQEKDTKKSSSGKSNGGNISGFFTKGVNPRDALEKESEKTVLTGKRTSPQEKNNVKQESSDECENENPLPLKEDPSPEKKTAKTYQRKAAVTKKKVETQPKRSRILKVESDSSEEEGSGSEQEKEEEAALEEAPSPAAVVTVSSEDESPIPTSEANHSSGRGKKRKQVDKTFQDDDGYFVTKKEYVEVTDSEEDAPAPSLPPAKKQDRSSPKKEAESNKKKATKKKSSPVKAKQASIMSFFKKKC